jgi:hypothetical protein
MLQSVFKELYDQGILIFLDTDNYVTNNTDLEVDTFVDRGKFLEIYTDPIDQGWIFCYTTNFDDVIETLKDDTCYLIEFGFNSDTEKKALEVGRALVGALTKHNFRTRWDEKALKYHKISTVITVENLPQNIQDMVEEYESESKK